MHKIGSTAVVIFFSLSSLFLFSTAVGQQWSWAVNALGDDQLENPDRDIVVDRNGNIFIAGYFTKTLTLGTFTLINPQYSKDLYVAQMDSAGNVLWAKSYDLGYTSESLIGITLDDSNNIYVTGGRDFEIFISKLNSLGDVIWSTDFNESGYGSDIALDQYDNIYISGRNHGNSLVAKLNEYGRILWTQKIVTNYSNGCWASDLAVDRLGNIYMAGGFDVDSIIVGTTKYRNTNGTGAKAFLVKYGPNGDVIWSKLVEGSIGSASVTRNDAGDIYFSAPFSSDQVLIENIIIQRPSYSTETAGFLAKFDSNGRVAWGTNGKKIKNAPKDVVTDFDGNLFSAGISFGNWGGTEMDFHLIKYNNLGDTSYTREILVGNSFLYGIDIDNFGNTYVIGNSDVRGVGIFGLAYFHPSTVFIAKFNTGGTTRRRPSVPGIHKRTVVCNGGTIPKLNAIGQNIKWYSDSLLTNLIGNGNYYQPNIFQTDTFYVTQTIQGITSWPKQVIISLTSVNNWTGAVDNKWENPLNWSCGLLPDENTDVIISAGTIILSSNVTIRSLTIKPGANLNIVAGNTLNVLK